MRRQARALVGTLAAALAAAAGFVLAGAAAPAHSASQPLSIAVSGDHFVDGAGQTVQLVGVNVPSSEYACVQGWGYSSADGPTLAGQIAAWGANAVRIPLNEDCWLGINGVDSAYSSTPYQQAIAAFVSDLNADGIYAILDLHWSAPGTDLATGQEPMPDAHSTAFWTSVATAFKSNPAVLFDVFNEPYSPSTGGSVSWSCWLSGGCSVSDTQGDTYTAVGMQALIDAVRATGATQPIMVGGLQYAEDLSGWLANEPTDTLSPPQLAASFHDYEGDGICDDTSCWDTTIAPIAAQVPVVTGELAEDECPSGTDDFDDTYMGWADQHGVSYLGWGWFYDTTPTCDNYYLVNADGSPATPNGVALYDHLQALGAPGGLTQTLTTTTPTSSTTPTTAITTSTGTAVTSRPPPPKCVVPRVVGDTLAKAERRIRAAHCKVGRIKRPRRRTDLAVASTRPRAGRQERAGTRVAIVLRRRRRA